MYPVPGRSIMEPSDLGIKFVMVSAETATRFARSVRARAYLEILPRLNAWRTTFPRAIISVVYNLHRRDLTAMFQVLLATARRYLSCYLKEDWESERLDCPGHRVSHVSPI